MAQGDAEAPIGQAVDQAILPRQRGSRSDRHGVCAASSRRSSGQLPPDRRGAVPKRRLALVGGGVEREVVVANRMLSASAAAPSEPGATTESAARRTRGPRDRHGEAARQQRRHERLPQAARMRPHRSTRGRRCRRRRVGRPAPAPPCRLPSGVSTTARRSPSATASASTSRALSARVFGRIAAAMPAACAGRRARRRAHETRSTRVGHCPWEPPIRPRPSPGQNSPGMLSRPRSSRA